MMGARVRTLCALLVPAALAGAGCVSDLDVTVEEQTLWEATLNGGLEHPGLSGTAAAVSTSTLTEAGIELAGLAPGVYTWRIRERGCQDPGEVVGGEGQYPDLVREQQEEGEGPDTVTVSAETAPFRGSMEPGTSYHAEVGRSASAERIACGAFERQ